MMKSRISPAASVIEKQEKAPPKYTSISKTAASSGTPSDVSRSNPERPVPEPTAQPEKPPAPADKAPVKAIGYTLRGPVVSAAERYLTDHPDIPTYSAWSRSVIEAALKAEGYL
jgi:hypothetical protein